MQRRAHYLCRDLVRCIDGLVEERIRDAASQTTETAAAVEHARVELGEVVESLIAEAIREAVEP